MVDAGSSPIWRRIPFLIASCHCGRSAAVQLRAILGVGLFLLAIVPAAAATYSGGSGTAQAPYRIATAADLIALGGTPADYGKHFVLVDDIDLLPSLPGRKVFTKAVIAPHAGAFGWPFSGTPFAGVFDGGNHAVSNLTIKGGPCLGLFGQVTSGATVKNVRVVHVNIATSEGYSGGLVGLVGGGTGTGTVTNCSCDGVISGNSYIGGLVGYNGCTSVTRCSSSVVVDGSKWSVGGLVGYNCGRIQQCYSTGAVSGATWVGGLVGENANAVIECYSTGAVRGSSSAGGLVGYDYPHSMATRCFWDIQTSGQTGSAGGAGKTTAQMRTAGTFLSAGWDFAGETVNGTEDVWMMATPAGYPLLAWQQGETAPVPVVEDFESRDFERFPWQHAGGMAWSVTSTKSYQGSYSARAGAIGDNDTSTLKLTLDCVAGEIRFRVSVSSERDSDKLLFRIDGQQVGEWSGEQAWTEVAFPVGLGIHTFEWEYVKDGSASDGDDTAWLDNIVWPTNVLPLPDSGPIIVGVVRANGEWDYRDPIGQYNGNAAVLLTQAGGLKDGNLCFSDRTYPWALTPAELVGAEYVRTFNSDKKSRTVTYTVTLSREAAVMITVDDRLFDKQGAVNLATARIVSAGRFVDTGLNLYVHEDTVTNRAQSVFSARLPAGTYVFSAMPLEGNFYIIAVTD